MGGDFGRCWSRCCPGAAARTKSPVPTWPLGIWLGSFRGTKLAHCAQLRIDPLLPEMLGVKRLGSQSSYSRFFGQFDSARMNSECFGRLWRWGWSGCPATREVTPRSGLHPPAA